MNLSAASRSWISSAVGITVIAFVIVAQLLPIALIVLFSFNSTARLSFPIQRLSLKWYVAACSQPGFRDALSNTVLAACLTALIAGLSGLLAAFAAQRLSARRTAAVEAALEAPNITPPLLIGVGLSLLVQAVGIAQGLATIVAGHVVVALPFVFASMRAKIATFDFSVIDAARDLGASPRRAFFDVTMPLMRSAMVSAALMAAALSMDEFIVTSFTHGSQDTIPTLTFGLLREGVDPTVNAMATIILAATLVLAWSGLSSSRREP